MKRTKIIAFIAVGLIVIVGFLIPGCGSDKPISNGDGSTTSTAVNAQIPSDMDMTENSTAADQNADKTDGGTASTTNPQQDGDPTVESATKEDAKDKTPEANKNEGEDNVVSGKKDKDTVQTGPASGEDRNDEIITEKEDKTPVEDEEEDKPVIIEDETVIKDGVTKGDAQIKDEETNVDDGNKNAPVYNPSIGGDNPFDNDIKTEIDDRPVEDFVGEGEDRPGEGIHF